MDGKLHLQSERGEISKVIFAGEAIGDQDSASLLIVTGGGTSMVPFLQKGDLCLLRREGVGE